MISICCVCNKIKHRGRWVAAEVCTEQEQLSHGYCPACYEQVMEDISLFLGNEETTQPLPVHAIPTPEFVGACA